MNIFSYRNSRNPKITPPHRRCAKYILSAALGNGLPRFDASELLALAAAATFTAAPAVSAKQAPTEENHPVRILFLCDLHVSPDTPSEDRLRRAVRKINATDADAVIVAGDLTNEGSDEELRCVKSILDLI